MKKLPNKILRNLSMNALTLKPIEFSIDAIVEEIVKRQGGNYNVITEEITKLCNEMNILLIRSKQKNHDAWAIRIEIKSMINLCSNRIYSERTEGDDFFSDIYTKTWLVTLRDILDAKGGC